MADTRNFIDNSIGPASNGDSLLETNRFLTDLSISYSENTEELSLTGIPVINSMIDNILTTIPGDRVYEPEFGSEFPLLLFEPCDEETAWRMETAVYDALKRWLPYITVILGKLNIQPVNDEAAFRCIIHYELKVGGIQGKYQAKFIQ